MRKTRKNYRMELEGETKKEAVTLLLNSGLFDLLTGWVAGTRCSSSWSRASRSSTRCSWTSPCSSRTRARWSTGSHEFSPPAGS